MINQLVSLKDITPKYADGFVLAVPKNKINEYLQLARMCGKIWLENGALEYRECVGDDLKISMGIPFPKMIKIKNLKKLLSSHGLLTNPEVIGMELIPE
jgi:uncharacterized protein YbaA (DUF1428 family)